MKNSIITLTADFGDTFAKSQLEAVIHSINPEAKFIVASNEITPFSILEGAFILSKFYEFTPKDSVHIAVVDPGVGSSRRGIVIKTKNYYFVGPDNGLLYPAAFADGIEKAYKITETAFGTTFANTFHGRDIFAKAAAYISAKRDITEFATEVSMDSLIAFEFPSNTIANIDPYGNIKSTIKPNGFKCGQELSFLLNGKEYKTKYCKTFSEVEKGELLFYHGSHDTLELAANLASAAELLNAKVGDQLHFK